MRKILSFIVTVVLIVTLFAVAVAMDVPGYVTAYTSSDTASVTGFSGEKEFNITSQKANVVVYILNKYEDNYKPNQPANFSTKIANGNIYELKIESLNIDGNFVYNDMLGVVKHNSKFAFISGIDTAVLNLMLGS